jgi:hypothetical protein
MVFLRGVGLGLLLLLLLLITDLLDEQREQLADRMLTRVW